MMFRHWDTPGAGLPVVFIENINAFNDSEEHLQGPGYQRGWVETSRGLQVN